MLIIGNHVSSSGGFFAMGQKAIELGGNTFAFFTRNPRGGKAKKIDLEDVTKFNSLAKENNFKKLVAHAPYTLNPCSASEGTREFALLVLNEDLEKMEFIPGNYYNFHPGSHVGQGVQTGIELICKALNGVLKTDQTTTVLLETMAGKGTEIGGKFEEIGTIIENIELKDKIGVCLDTCHIWDGGYDIVNDLDGVINSFDKAIGIKNLKAVHINDSQNDLGSHKDRHAKIGEGKIGIDAFTRIINHEAFKDIPFVLETPNDDEGWAKEIKMLRDLYNS